VSFVAFVCVKHIIGEVLLVTNLLYLTLHLRLVYSYVENRCWWNKVEDVVGHRTSRLAVRRMTVCFQVFSDAISLLRPIVHQSSQLNNGLRQNNTVAAVEAYVLAQPLAIRRLLDVPFEGRRLTSENPDDFRFETSRK
jgi:hypothetical protein